MKYYTYFQTIKNLEYPRIGTGLKNPSAHIMQSEYNRSFNGYKANHDFWWSPQDTSKFTYRPNPLTKSNGESYKTATLGEIFAIVSSVFAGLGLCIYCGRRQYTRY